MEMRAGDTEREAAIERLTAALGEQRLDVTEYDARLKKITDASTTSEVDSVVNDLPVTREQAERSRTETSRATRNKLLKEWGQWAAVTILLVAIWGATSLGSGEPMQFWPAVPSGVWAIILIAGMIWPSKKQEGKK
jgi:hypothetical protein